jgi:Aerotolerance regulator N-terminal/von Willebrand factor type A domain
MSALTPLYLLGMLAVAAPILFHLIRRRPRGEVPFSSLIFLSPSPPRLTRRSRLDNILLLLLRAAALCLLAFAFARPFLREAAHWSLNEDTPRRTAILIDTSASMRRGDLWARARAAARQVADDCRPNEELAVLAFDRTTRTVLGFRESIDLAQRRAVASARIDGLEPTWGSTDLGQALIDAVAAIEDIADSSERSGRMPRRIVLISDLQQGSRLEDLGEFEWPSDVELELKTVADDSPNAGLQRLAEPAEAAKAGLDPVPRVRVFNDAESRREKFALQWTGPAGVAVGDPIDVYVPPGESRVVRVPRDKGNTAVKAIVLRGDAAPFDNTLYVMDEPREEATVLFIGNDRPDDTAGLLFYLMRVFIDTPRRTVKVVAQPPTAPVVLDPTHRTPLVILAAETSSENVRRLKENVKAGGTLLYVAARPGPGETVGALLETPARLIEEASSRRDVLIGEVAFDHPLFAPFASPQYSDFTKIHFWKHRKIREGEAKREGEAPSEPSPDPARTEPRPPGNANQEKARTEPRPPGNPARVLARFENGDPAVLEKPLGKGSVVVMASGWNPEDSQLARSSKFVPLMMAMLDRHDPRPFETQEHTVGDPIALPTPKDPAKALVVHKPSGSSVSMAPGATLFEQADEPGIYAVDGADAPRSFVVNLDPSESKTAASGVETLEQFGCRLANPTRQTIDREQLRQLQNAELEGRQKLWRWLILATVGILIVETGLAGRIKRVRPEHTQAEVLSS